MRVQRVVMPATGETSWTVVDADFCPVEPIERYLAHLVALERSPNTVRAYAHGLRLWWEFLDERGVAWDRAGAEDVSRFVAWMRAPAPNVVVLDETVASRSSATVNRHLAALFGLYDFPFCHPHRGEACRRFGGMAARAPRLLQAVPPPCHQGPAGAHAPDQAPGADSASGHPHPGGSLRPPGRMSTAP